MTTMEELKELFASEVSRTKAWQEKHDSEASTFRREILEKIKPFEEFSSGLSILWKILLGVSALIMSVVKMWDWVKEHVK